MADTGAWEAVNRVTAGADTIDRLTQLYREGGRTWEESRRMAIEAWRAAQTPPSSQARDG